MLFAFYWLVRFSSLLFYINWVYSWFSEGKEFRMTHIVQDGITFCTPFSNRLWIHQVYCFVASITTWLKQIFEEGKYCGYEACKHGDCRSKNLECYHGLKSLLILILIFGVKANLTLISFVFYLKDNVFTVLVK